MKRVFIILTALFCFNAVLTNVSANTNTSYNGNWGQTPHQFIKANNMRVALFSEYNKETLKVSINNFFKNNPNIHIINIQFQVSSTGRLVWYSALVTYYIN